MTLTDASHSERPVPQSLLACPACGNALTGEGSAIRCASGHSFERKDGRVYFDLPPGDYEDDGDGPNVPKEAWGNWRRHNFDYFSHAFASLPDSAVVLDLGAGPGQFSELTDRFSTFISMDFRPFRPVNVVADLTKRLPLKDGAVDAIMASNVLEHIPDTRELLQEAFRVLKPGGVLVATIPFLMRVHQKPYDFNRYTKYQLEALARGAGFAAADAQALSAPADVYESVQNHFYLIALARAHGVTKLILRAFRFGDRLRRHLVRALSSATPAEDFTEGYGLTARK